MPEDAEDEERKQDFVSSVEKADNILGHGKSEEQKSVSGSSQIIKDFMGGRISPQEEEDDDDEELEEITNLKEKMELQKVL